MLEITSELVRILVCPVSQGKLIYDQINNELVCLDSALAYPVKDGVPLLLVEHARKLSENDLRKFNLEEVKQDS
jgi:uncharacterized protein YbaR (Trm112 family)